MLVYSSEEMDLLPQRPRAGRFAADLKVETEAWRRVPVASAEWPAVLAYTEAGGSARPHGLRLESSRRRRVPRLPFTVLNPVFLH